MKKTKAVGFYEHLPIKNKNSFEDVLVNVSSLKDHDILVKVDGTSVNPVDTYVRKFGRKGKLVNPKIIGWDSVGTITEIGSKVSLFKVGDRVWYAGDFTKPGSNMREQVVDERIVGIAPKSLNDVDAAGIPLVGLTAYESLFEKLRINKSDAGKTILIINGSGGVGSMAIQLAKLAGLYVIATASRPESIKWVRKLGADRVVDHHQSLVDQVKTKENPYVDYILNLNNLDAHWNEITELIKPDGIVAATTENHRLIDLQKLTKKRVTFAWEWMYSKSYYQLDSMITQHQILNRLSELYDKEKLLPITTKTFSPINADNMRKAHADVETGKMVGKVTLTKWEN